MTVPTVCEPQLLLGAFLERFIPGVPQQPAGSSCSAHRMLDVPWRAGTGCTPGMRRTGGSPNATLRHIGPRPGAVRLARQGKRKSSFSSLHKKSLFQKVNPNVVIHNDFLWGTYCGGRKICEVLGNRKSTASKGNWREKMWRDSVGRRGKKSIKPKWSSRYSVLL